MATKILVPKTIEFDTKTTGVDILTFYVKKTDWVSIGTPLYIPCQIDGVTKNLSVKGHKNVILANTDEYVELEETQAFTNPLGSVKCDIIDLYY